MIHHVSDSEMKPSRDALEAARRVIKAEDGNDVQEFRDAMHDLRVRLQDLDIAEARR